MIKVIEQAPRKIAVDFAATISMEEIVNCLDMVFDVIKTTYKDRVSNADTQKMDTVMNLLTEIENTYISE